jgi:hypothetical protein
MKIYIRQVEMNSQYTYWLILLLMISLKDEMASQFCIKYEIYVKIV